jgi:hypothetical protein
MKLPASIILSKTVLRTNSFLLCVIESFALLQHHTRVTIPATVNMGRFLSLVVSLLSLQVVGTSAQAVRASITNFSRCETF